MAGRAPVSTLLQTKFAVPAGPAATVVRPRLLDVLDDGVRHPLTLLSAPAGTGKTALLSTWIADGRAPGPVAWLSLDADDADRRRFWAAVLEVLARSRAGEPVASLAVQPREPVELVVPALIDALVGHERPVVLVLDDFHEVADVVHEDIERLLRFPLSALRLVLVTRADPPVGLGRLRLDGGLTELRAGDLAFSREETAALMRGLGLQLTAADVTRLWQRTEGWAAGLRLAALSLQGHTEPARFIEQFAGTDASVSDYLVNEVLARQPTEAREFLLRTSIVDVLTGDLANALTGASNGRRLLVALERRGVLLSAPDDSGALHRYHPLFAELLRAELRSELGAEVAELHRRAAVWLAAHGEDAPALRHAAAGGAWDLAGELSAERWVHLLIRGEIGALRPVLDGMPRERVDACPELALAFGGALLANFDDAGAEPYLRRAEEGEAQVPPARRPRFAAAMAASRLYLGRIRGEPDSARAAARALLERQPALDGEREVRSLALGGLGIVELWTGDLAAAARDLERAHAAALEARCDWLVLVAAAHLAVLAMFRSEFAHAARRADEALALAEHRGWTRAWPAGAAFGVAAGLRMQRGRLDEAEALLTRADEALRNASERPLRAVHAFNRAVLLADRGHPAAALDVLRAGRDELGGWPLLAPMAEMMASLEALLRGATGERDAAHEALERAHAEGSSLTIATTLARLRLQDGDPLAARAALAPYLQDDLGEMLYFRAEAWLLDAQALEALADRDAAARSLECALDLAEPAGLERLLVAHGRALRPLLHRQLSVGTAHPTFLSEALARIDRHDPGHRPVPMRAAEPLSERQHAILRYLPTMMSNQEIAGELSVSVNTVKSHLKAIYRKLDAPSRRDAVDRARELGLMP